VTDATLYGVVLGAIENQLDAALTRGIATSINPLNWANQPTDLGAQSGPGGSLPATTVYYVVTTLNAAGESTVSNEVSFTPTNGSVQLTWKPVNGATGYNIYRGSTSGGENQLIKQGETNTTYSDTGGTGTPQTPPVYYPAGSTSDLYAQFFHQPSVSLGGLAYGSPYDDQGGQSSTITAVPPLSIRITLPSWSASLTQPAPVALGATNPSTSPRPMGISYTTQQKRGQRTISVYDPTTGALRYTVTPLPGYRGKFQVLTLDIDGDRVPDLRIGFRRNGRLFHKIYHGVTGALLVPLRLATNLTYYQDINGDGLLDRVVLVRRNGKLQSLIQFG
jgi:hypothetical protein